MQTVIQVVSSRAESLRERIVNDPQLEHFGLKVDREKKKGRQYGWAKIYRNGAHGALNLQWLAGPRTLVGRIVTKGEGCPALLAGTFLCYVLARYRNEVKAVHVWIQEGDEEDADEV